MGKKRSRSRSRSRSRESRRRKEKHWKKIQTQVDNLTKVVESLVNVQQEQVLRVNSLENPARATTTPEAEKNKKNPENISSESPEVPKESVENDTKTPTEPESAKGSVFKVLGLDPDEGKLKSVKFHPQINDTWGKWKIEGLPEKNKKDILESYKRKGEFYTEAPKLNLEIVPLLSDIAKKRDEHFAETQSCVGTALCALGAAVSLLLDQPEEGIDEDLLTDYISHAGQILADVFYQQSVARKSYITPQLNKNIKPLVDTMLSNEWLYGDDLKDKVKDVKEIETACSSIKEKPAAKPSTKTQSQGNGRRSPADYRPVGYNQRFRPVRFRSRTQRSYHQQQSKTSKTTSQSSSKK
ncbi:hypothetical protein PUN28_012765 [Cardiocondyla obscurior]|uniref:Uncharacterized protein n=1 Tax=Cardiocondyla obscurior TaxID=286306 RepID=A0AAW2F7N2_9HYME